MPRPKNYRKMGQPPVMHGFQPFGLPESAKESVEILFEEYEAVRLADYLNLSQEDASKIMKVSRPTFTRIYDVARKKVAKAFAEGRSMIFTGGNIEFESDWHKCGDCYSAFVYDSRKEACTSCNSKNISPILNYYNSRRSKNEHCYCPECSKFESLEIGAKCNEHNCPVCGKPMIKTSIAKSKLKLKIQ